MKLTSARAAHLKVGRFGERVALRLLEAKNYRILGRNWRTRAGELDLIARDGATLVFVEVKTLRARPGVEPGENLSARQRKRNFNAGKVFRRCFSATHLPARFDLIEVSCPRRGRLRAENLRYTLNCLPQLEPEP